MAFQDVLIGLLVLLVGAAFCFAGYRFFRILIAIWGFFAGFDLGAAGMTALFGQNFLGTTTGWILGVVVGPVAHSANIYPCVVRSTGPRRVIYRLIPPGESSSYGTPRLMQRHN